MAREHITLKGEVIAVSRGDIYRVKCVGGHEVVARIAGRLRKRRIRIVLGDTVTVALSPYDTSHGLVMRRMT